MARASIFGFTALLMTVSAAQAFQTERTVLLAGEVSNRETFRKEIGDGLVFVLAPTGTGWTIEVHPVKSEAGCEDILWISNPPFRAFNDRFLYASYGVSSMEVVERSPREFRFVLNCAAYRNEVGWADIVMRNRTATPARLARAEAKMGTSPTGRGTLWIEDSRIGPERYSPIERLRFRVDLRIPEGAAADPGEPDPPEVTLPLGGQVLDAFSGKPVAGASVRLGPEAGPPQTSVTGVDGRFQFRPIEAQLVYLRVTRAGYTPADQRILLAQGGKEPIVRIAPEGSVAGRVTDNQGAPLPGFRLRLLGLGHRGGRPSLHFITEGTAGPEGRYSFPKLSSGDYLVQSVVHPLALQQPARVRGGEARADFRIDTKAAAQAVTVRGVIPGDFDLRFLYCHARRLAPAGVLSWGDDFNPETRRFSLRLSPGKWSLGCTYFNDDDSRFGQMTLTIPDGATSIPDLELPLYRAVKIPVEFEGVEPRDLQLEPRDPPDGLDGPLPLSTGGPVPPGAYRVMVSPEYCFGSVTWGRTDLLRHDLVVDGRSTSPPPIRVARAEGCGSLSISTRPTPSGEIVGVLMLIVPEDDRLEAVVTTGGISLVPGNYRVYPFTDRYTTSELDWLDYRNPAAMRDYRSYEVKIGKDRQVAIVLE